MGAKKLYTYELHHVREPRRGRFTDTIDIDPDGAGRVISIDDIRVIPENPELRKLINSIGLDNDSKHEGDMPLVLNTKIAVKRDGKDFPIYIHKYNHSCYNLHVHEEYLKEMGYVVQYDVERSSGLLGCWTLTAEVTNPTIPEFYLQMQTFVSLDTNTLNNKKEALFQAVSSLYFGAEDLKDRMVNIQSLVDELKSSIAEMSAQTPEDMKKAWGIIPAYDSGAAT